MTTNFDITNRAMPRRIRLINWHGHENATLEVNGVMLAIIGENGSGKSLILDAIDWALFPAPSKQFNAAAREEMVAQNQKIMRDLGCTPAIQP